MEQVNRPERYDCRKSTKDLSSHCACPAETAHVKIEKTFKGKYPLTICRLTGTGRRAFESYAQKMRVVGASIQ